MDLDLIRSLYTLASFASFVGIAGWAYSARSRARFEEAARLPFEDGELDGERREAPR